MADTIEGRVSLALAEEGRFRFPYLGDGSDPEGVGANRTEWVRALRSGDFKQGFGVLVMVEGAEGTGPLDLRYCCLGVAVSMLPGDAGLVSVAEGRTAFLYHDRPVGVCSFQQEAGYGTCEKLLPDRVRRLLGLRSTAGAYLDARIGEVSLAGLNDSRVPLADIADLIEREPTGLFEEVR